MMLFKDVSNLMLRTFVLCLSITIWGKDNKQFFVSAFTATTPSTTATASSSSSKSMLLAAERDRLMELLPQSGFICNNPKEVRQVCDACTELEKTSSSSNREFLDGKWRLRFTSASPLGLLAQNDALAEQFVLPEPIRKLFIDDSPFLATSFEQNIDNSEGRIINSIDLQPWPAVDNSDNDDDGDDGNALNQVLNNVLSSIGPLGQTLDALKEAKIHLDFDHSFSIQQQNNDNIVIDLQLEVVRRKLESAADTLPSFIPRESSYDLPFNPTGSFETTYLDQTIRIARGTTASGSLPLFSNDVFVFERVGGAGGVVGIPDSSVIGDECELVFEEDGETPVILCDDEDSADYMPSD